MSIYLDTSVIVPLFLADPFVARVKRFLDTGPSGLVVSDFVSAEFASVLGVRVRAKTLKADDARAAVSHFDVWVARTATRMELAPADVRASEAFLRRFDLTLRAPDALNISIAQRLNAELATFDERMAECARALGVRVAAI